MPKLLLKHEGMILNTYELKEGKTTIGRKSDNDIQLNDAVASSHHACIVLKPNEYLEEQLDAKFDDIGSTNGTQVNGCLVQSIELRNGDEIQIGSQIFIYETEDTIGMDETAIYIPDED